MARVRPAPVSGRTASYVVAANNSTAEAKAQADYLAGSTNNYVQGQAAIDALPLAGGTIVFMPGTYNLGTGGMVVDGDLHRRVLISCFGAIFNLSAGQTGIQLKNGYWSYDRGLYLDGWASDSGGIGVDVYDCIHPVLTRIKIKNATTACIRFSGELTANGEEHILDDIRVDPAASGVGLLLTKAAGLADRSYGQLKIGKLSGDVPANGVGLKLATGTRWGRGLADYIIFWLVGNNAKGFEIDGDMSRTQVRAEVERSAGTGGIGIDILTNATVVSSKFIVGFTGTPLTKINNAFSKRIDHWEEIPNIVIRERSQVAEFLVFEDIDGTDRARIRMAAADDQLTLGLDTTAQTVQLYNFADTQRAGLLLSKPTLVQANVNVAVAQTLTSLAITLPVAEADAVYGILVVPQWNTTVYTSAKTTTGFTANFGTASPTGGSYIDWYLYRKW